MFKAISNIILASLMVLVTTGVTITQHFCHNQLQNTGIFTLNENCKEIKSCCGAAEVAHCKSEQAQKDDCCKNENVFVKFLSQFTVNKSEQVAVFVPLSEMFDIFSIDSYPVFNRIVVSLKHPPSPAHDVQVLFSTFLL